jgi:deoxyribodipyrimidine photolyase-related protein
VRLLLVLGDQLSEELSALAAGDPARDVVVMAEVMEEGTYVRHHPKKIAFCLSAMRTFAGRLEALGWRVAYSRLDDPGNSQSIPGELLRRAEEFGASEIVATTPGEWRLIRRLREMPLTVEFRADTRFLCSGAEFRAWAEGRRELRMEWFYRMMRERTGLLMESGKPVGGRWNWDSENRKGPPRRVAAVGPLRHEPDAVTAEVLNLVEARFPGHFGRLRPFWFATDRAGALESLRHFLTHGLPLFGDYQDAMRGGDPFLWHSVLAQYMNAGLLGPLEVCRAVEAEWREGRVPLNAAEGYIRQILGWREFVRGIYFLAGPDYTARNALGHSRKLPPLYWGAPTRMACVREAVAQTRDEAYAHHIQRLMVTGNFALLAGVDPAEVHEWYLAVYADAYEWVEAPNVIGMSQWADGGMVGSKPYISSGAYLARMGDHCGSCAYEVERKTGEGACPFNLLYWDFVARHAERLRRNPRIGQAVRTWEKMAPDRQALIREGAAGFLARMEAGEAV